MSDRQPDSPTPHPESPTPPKPLSELSPEERLRDPRCPEAWAPVRLPVLTLEQLTQLYRRQREKEDSP